MTAAVKAEGSKEGWIRSVNIKKNIIFSFIIKGGSILIGIVLVPMTIGYVDETRYGIWITISSLVGWMSFLDIGLGNGLRNRLAMALAVDDKEAAKSYISTTYFVLGLIMALALCAFGIANSFLSWPSILNAPASMARELKVVSFLVFDLFCLRFVLNIVTTLYLADQRTAQASLLTFLSNLLSLIFILVLVKSTHGSLLLLSSALMVAPVLVLLAATAFLFRGRYKPYRPSFAMVRMNQCRNLFTLGVKFFIVQLAAILLYETSNIIIIQLLGPKEVTSYNIAFRYFGVITMISSIIFTPYWSGITEAFAKEDFHWIRITMRKLVQTFAVLTVLALFMLLVSGFAYRLWVGQSIQIPLALSATLTVYVVLNSWNSVFGIFLNGVGKIKLQLVLGLTSALLNVPLGIFLGRKFGTAGVVMATILVSLAGMLIYPIQFKRIINRSDTGIWAG